jgi:hemerythrin-like domain-containing protein
VREAAGKVLRYFDQAAPLHHADEEEDLLPRLRQRLDDRQASPELAGLLAGLHHEHSELDARWQALRPFLIELQGGRPVAAGAYREAAEAFYAAEMDHVSRENAHLLPAAETHLTAPDREALGRAMAHRRGVRQNNRD